MKKVFFIIAMAISMTQMNAQTEGGKYLDPKSKFNGKPFVFSNRGETEAILKLNAAYNNLDVKTCMSLSAEKIKLTDFEGNNVVLTAKDWEAYFSQYKSLNWEIKAIVPIRIKDTDPSSGVFVVATETRVGKDGKVWKKELNEFFMFNLDMKIDTIIQYYQDVK
ncbi:MAG: hypothetical protein RLZZ44_1431 [Bacteroidota bacterium]|jgi:hypothetical protein